MSFPRYELSIPRESDRVSPPRHPRPARVRRRWRVRGVPRAPMSRPSGRLDVHQYLELEFTVEERR